MPLIWKIDQISQFEEGNKEPELVSEQYDHLCEENLGEELQKQARNEEIMETGEGEEKEEMSSMSNGEIVSDEHEAEESGDESVGGGESGDDRESGEDGESDVIYDDAMDHPEFERNQQNLFDELHQLPIEYVWNSFIEVILGIE